MTTSRDDDALHWAGDDDPTLTPPIQAGASGQTGASGQAEADHRHPEQEKRATPQQPTVVEQAELAEDKRVDNELQAAEKASGQVSSAALVTLGILGGIYLLYTIGWGIIVARTQVTFFPLDGLFLQICFQIGQVLSVAASPLWFLAALLLTQRRSWRSRLGWLLLGVFVLVPWPIILGA